MIKRVLDRDEVNLELIFILFMKRPLWKILPSRKWYIYWGISKENIKLKLKMFQINLLWFIAQETVLINADLNR